jgi:hypothetical protein
MSNEPSGAVDNDYDDAERDARDRLTERLDAMDREIKPHDLVIDLVQGRPLFVRRSKGTAVDYFESESFDLTTYKAHPWLPITPDDEVFECVFVPTKPQDIPSERSHKTYDYPRGRLARIPVEWLYGSDTRPQKDAKASLVAAMVERAPTDAMRQYVVDVAVDTIGPRLTDDAIERTGRDPSRWGADSDARGAINRASADDDTAHDVGEE